MMKLCELDANPDGSFNYFPTIHDAVHKAMDSMVPTSVIIDNMRLKPNHDVENFIVPPSGVYRTISM